MSLRNVSLACSTLFFALALAGCPTEPVPVDAPTGDAPGTDGSRPDGGDAGTPIDGDVDGGGGMIDGGGSDAAPVCGDTFVEGTETCDDGNTATGDGCDDTCQEEAGYDCSSGVCEPICGDSTTIAPETCDDGNAVTETCAYGLASCLVCDDTCTEVAGATSECGDSSVDAANEACDDGNTTTETNCPYGTATCTGCDDTCDTSLSLTGAVCGDSNIDVADGEECDDGNIVAGDGCDATCQSETVCGNGAVEGTETCDDSNAVTESCMYGLMSCTVCTSICQDGPGLTSFCGDASVDAANELCDDGNSTTETACPYGMATCTLCDGTCDMALALTGPYCGDSVIQAAGMENCDDGNTVAGDGCSPTCRREPRCGDSLVDAPETCDDGNMVTEACAYGAMSCMVCDATCTSVAGATAFCGDGVVQAANGEVCDDMNTNPTDGCAGCRMLYGELEPNDDGATIVGGGTTGNDFDAAGGIAVMNANAQASVIPLRVSDGNAAVAAAIGTAGDEDVFLVENDTAGNVTLQVDTWNLSGTFTIGTSCGTTGVDTFVHIRNAAGTSLASNDDRVGGSDYCSRATVTLTPGQLVYVHVLEYQDDGAIPAYALQVTYTPIVCGNGAVAAGEPCDDGNTASGDGCSMTCQIEPGYNCSGAPSVCSSQLPNATCAGAISLGSSGTVSGVDLARGGTSPSGTGCNTTANFAAYYTVTVPANSATTVVATPTSPATANAIIEVIDTCAATACLANTNAAGALGAETVRLTNATGADVTRVVAVGSSSTTTTGLVNISVSSAPIAANAGCGGAIDLGTMGSRSGDQLFAGGTGPSGTGCSTATGSTLWYQISVPANSISTVVATPTGAPSTDVVIEAVDACASTACVGSVDAITTGVETLRLTNLTAAPVTRFIAVSSDGAAGAGTFDLAVTFAPAPFSLIPLACVDTTAGTALTLAGGTMDDGYTATTALPFTYTMYGTAITHWSASTNGWAAMFPDATGVGSSSLGNPTVVPSATTPNGFLAPFWDDLDLRTGGTLRTITTGAPGSQRVTIEWSGVVYGTTSAIRYQLQIVEGGPVEFHYCSGAVDARASGSEATVAAENTTGTVGAAYSINSASITPGTTALRWMIP